MPRNLSRRRKRNRALLDATLMDDLPAMRQALADGADVNARDAEHEETPLMLVRSEAAARLLLAQGADVGARDNRGQTAFMFHLWGLQPTDLDITQASHTAFMPPLGSRSHLWPLLVEHGADINAQDADGETALIKAVMKPDLEGVAQLLALGADLRLRDSNGWTALTIAIEGGRVDIAERLRAAGAEE